MYSNLMKRSSKKTKVILAVLIGTIFIISTSSIMVNAAIPNSTGTINSCYRNSATIFDPKGGLRVIDAQSGETCNTSETALTWNQGGQVNRPLAYAHILINQTGNVTLDAARSSNISNLYSSPGGNQTAVCLTVNGSPKSVSSAPGYANGTNVLYRFSIKDQNGWSFDPTLGTQYPATVCDQNATSANVSFIGINSPTSAYSVDYFVTVY